MIETIQLPQDRFKESVLSKLNLKNFIFGKNGTGKSSITQCIREQYSEQYDIRIFQGYEQIVGEYGGLNLISLGVENVRIQSEIKIIEKKIQEITKELNDTSENSNTIGAKLKRQNSKVDELAKEFEDFFKSAAKKMKENEMHLFSTSYNKNNFEADIEKRSNIKQNHIYNKLRLELINL